MKLMVTAPAYWIDEATARQKAWIYLASCSKAGIGQDIRCFFGVGSTQYPGETVMTISGLAEFLKRCYRDFTHVLFTHAWDQLFVRPLDAIIRRYEAMERPPFFHAAAIQRANVHTDAYDQFFPELTPFRFPGAGFIAEIPLVIDLFTKRDVSHTHDASWAYFDAWRDGWFRPVLDTQCVIFQSMDIRKDGADDPNCVVRDGKLYNTLTRTYPCIAHFGGYVYVDPETGKDRIIEPWARALGVIV